MERGVPIRKPHTSTSDLLTWSSESPPASAVDGSSVRCSQPSDRIGKVLFGGQVTDEEAESLNKRKPCSDYKLKEMTGSSIFSADVKDGSTKSGNDDDNNLNNRTSVRIIQQAANGISQISFSTEESFSPKRPSSLTEVAKQRELGGTLENETTDVSKTNKHLSDAKSKELSGSDIFGPPPSEIPPRSTRAAFQAKDAAAYEQPLQRSLRTSVKVSNPAGGQSHITFGDEPTAKTSKKIHDQKLAELTGNDIFKGENAPSGSDDKLLLSSSVAKLKEMSGSDIFADGKPESRDYFGGVRKPPGGESSIALI